MYYYQFNIGDYQSHTGHLEPLEDCAYRRMLDWCYLHERPLPDDIDQIAKLIRMRSHSDCIASVLREFFVRTADGKGWWQDRISREIERTGEKSRKASESAKVRWAKEKTDANALRPKSESNATHNPIPNTHNPIPKKKAAGAAVSCPQGVEQQVWQDWLAIRQAKKLPLTETAWEQMQEEAGKAGLPMETVIRECCLRGWAAFKASWWQRELKKPDFVDQRKEMLRGLTSGLMGGDGNVKLIGS